MSDPQGADRRPGARRRRPSPAERRAERAAVEDPAVVMAAAARFLEARARSVEEVRRRLSDAGYQATLVDGVIARLVDLGILDDEAFARTWVESRDRARPRGQRVLRSELRRKGIAPATADDVLEARDGGDTPPRAGAEPHEAAESAEESAARRLLARHAHALARVTDPRRRRQRAYGLLARNGFSPDIIGPLVRELDASPADGGDPGAETDVADGEP